MIDDLPGTINTEQQGFEEQIGFLLTAPLAVDGGTIAAGIYVDSHINFLNTISGSAMDTQTWIFAGDIIGIMTASFGADVAASSPFLGATGTIYPGGGFTAYGLEGNDSFSIVGDTLTLTMYVSEPGDWIRVITASSVPEPSTVLLLGSGLVGLIGYRMKKKSA